MVNYYYARNEKEENGVRFLEVPLRVNPLTAGETNQPVCKVKIGGMHFLCTYQWIPADFYTEYKRMLEKDAKEEERRMRCLIPDGKGGRIMCPECNHCCKCEKPCSFDFDNGHDTSLDSLMDFGFEPEADSETESDFDIADESANPETKLIFSETEKLWEQVMQDMIDELTAINVKYGLIFRELLRGVMKPSEIARNTGLKANRTCEDLPKVQALAARRLSAIKAKYHLD